MSVASCQQIKKPGREVKRNRANRKEIHQMNVSITGERAGKDSPQTAQACRKYRAHILSWCMD